MDGANWCPYCAPVSTQFCARPMALACKLYRSRRSLVPCVFITSWREQTPQSRALSGKQWRWLRQQALISVSGADAQVSIVRAAAGLSRYAPPVVQQIGREAGRESVV